MVKPSGATLTIRFIFHQNREMHLLGAHGNGSNENSYMNININTVIENMQVCVLCAALMQAVYSHSKFSVYHNKC